MFDNLPTLDVTTGTVVAFVFVTLGFLLLAGFSLWMTQTRELRLVLLGLAVAAAATGYSSVVTGGALLVVPSLMKLSFLLVLGGVACSLLRAAAPHAAGNPPAPPETEDVP